MNILFICTKSNQIITFRKSLIKELQNRGAVISAIAFDEDYKEQVNAMGVNFYCVPAANRSLNPFQTLLLKGRITKIIKQVSPDLVFTFMLKPNVFGVLAAHKAGIKDIYSMVEGAGDVFIKNGFKWKVIRSIVCRLYKKSFKFSKRVFFLNNDDKAEFIERKLVNGNKCEVIHGIGVDLDRFAYKPLKNNRTFLMIARMLKTKGVFEYCECARIVKQKYPDAVFNYLGAEGDIKLTDIDKYIKDDIVKYLGTTNDVRLYIEDALLLLLSSYREGLPMSIMEAESMGRGIITSNSVGCKDTVIDGYNGFLIEKKDVKAMSEKCIYAIEHFDEMVVMGQNARKFAEENFDCNKINEKIVKSIGLI